MIDANEEVPIPCDELCPSSTFLLGHLAVQRLRCFSPQDLKDLDELSFPIAPRQAPACER